MLILVIILVVVLSDCGGRSQVTPCDAVVWFEDRDGDGVGSSSTTEACEQPDGFSPASGDCDDDDPGVLPGVFDGCDGVDRDCDGLVDEDSPGAVWFTDADGDGFGDRDDPGTPACGDPGGASLDASDCDDGDALVHPGATETCDGVDQDCDGLVDDAPADGIESWADLDGDGFGDDSAVVIGCIGTGDDVAGDCDDTDPDAFPGAPELCNGRDDDCDGDLDDGLASQPFWVDQDGDGFGDGQGPSISACAPPAGTSADATDCDDSSPEVFPGAPELCNDEDDDCDGTSADEHVDDDADGHSVCDGDCDDAQPSVHPGAQELCDAFDNDCSGRINDPWLDAWEWNPDLQSAPRIANDDQQVTIHPNISGPDDERDWFEMDTFDDADPLFTDDFEATARIEDIPPGVQLALHLWRNDVFGVANLVDSDSTWGDGVLEVSRDGIWGSNDGNLYFIEVERLAGFSCEQTYTLHVANHD